MQARFVIVVLLALSFTACGGRRAPVEGADCSSALTASENYVTDCDGETQFVCCQPGPTTCHQSRAVWVKCPNACGGWCGFL